MWLRISAVAVLLFGVLFLPFWAYIILTLAAMAYFPIFWEGLIMMLIVDVSFGVSTGSGLILNYFFAAIVVLVLIELLKTRLKFYPHT